MPTVLKTKNSVTTTVAPTSLAQGELAVNITDKKMWVGNAATTPVQLFGAGADGSFVNLAYTGTLTGGTGIVNLGSGQFYKDASGNVGVGTTTPSSYGKFHVRGVQTIATFGNVSASFSDGATGSIYIQHSSGLVQLLSDTALAFGTQSAERMRIDSSGNVGIGTSSPVYQTQIYGSGQTTAALTDAGNKGGSLLLNTPTVAGGDGGALLIGAGGSGAKPFAAVKGLLADGGGNTTGSLAFSTRNATGDTALTERMRIDSSGNVGIGTSSPVNNGGYGGLTLNGTSGSIYSMMYNGTENLRLFAGNNEGSIQYSSAGVLTFVDGVSGGTERMRIDSSGNLLVGTTSAIAGTAERMTVVSTGNSPAAIFKSASGASDYTTVNWNNATSGDNKFLGFYTEAGATLRGSITYNRAGGLTAYNTTSDYRSKDIISNTINSGEVIDSVPVYMGKMKGATQARPMFIAHETPDYAHTGEKDAVDKDGKPVYQQMDASSLVPILWAEIQSLRKRVAQLESK